MEEDEDVEVCVISKGPPFLSPLTVTMTTVAGRQGMTSFDLVISRQEIPMAIIDMFICTHKDYEGA